VNAALRFSESEIRHTTGAQPSAMIAVTCGRESVRLIGRKSDYRFVEFEYPWTSDTEFAHKIELKGSMSIQCSGATNGIVRACPAATSIAANRCLPFMYTQRAL